MPPTTLPAGAATGSFWDLLAHMSGFATVILLVLVFMSIVSWAIIIHKFRVYRAVSQSNQLFIQSFRKRKRLIDAEAKCAPHKASPLFKVLVDGFRDLESIVAKKKGRGNIQAGLVELNGHDLDAIQKTLERSSNERVTELEKYVVFLATTANAAPFLGLLGTCWGIMNSFMSIGAIGLIT